MTNSPFRVLIVEDDFRIARMHGKYMEMNSDYTLMGIAHNYEEALAQITNQSPDLLLLDVYLPDDREGGWARGVSGAQPK